MRRRGTRVATALASALVGLQAVGASFVGHPAAAGAPPTATVTGAMDGVPAPPNGLLGFHDDGRFEVMWPSSPGSTTPVLGADAEGPYSYDGPAWSPDGRTLASIRQVKDVQSIQLSDWSGRPIALLGSFVGGRVSGVWWVGDQLLVAWRVGVDRSEIWQLTPRSGEAQRIAVLEDPLAEATAAPDGSAIAYLRRADDRMQVVRHDLVEGSSTVLFSHSYAVHDVDWSPDGASLAAVVGGGLWLMGADGSAPHEAHRADGYAVRHTTWSPDSATVAFTATSQDVSVGALDVATGVVTPLLRNRWGLMDLAWQPLPECSVNGTDDDDHLVGSPGDDVICGGEGDDVVEATAGNDIVLGGGGTDLVDHSAMRAAVVVDLDRFWAGAGTGRTMLAGVEDVTGSRFGDHLVGDSSGNRLGGGGGADLLVGGGGDDALLGGRGVDTVSFNARQAFEGFDRTTVDVDLARGTAVGKDGHTDTLRRVENVVGSSGPDVVRGDDGANLLAAPHRRAVVEGRGGRDTIHTRGLVTYEHAPGPVTVDAVDFRAVTVTGADGADQLLRYSALRGSAYDDVLTGSLGHVEGGGGDDVITPSWLNHVDGGPGSDTLDASLLGHGVDVRPGDGEAPGRWFRSGTTGRTQYAVTGFEEFRLSDERDVFTTDASADYRVDAAGGEDVVRGGGGDDLIRAGRGDDLVAGGDGADRLRPGAGANEADGGPGWDRCARTRSDDVRRCEARLH